MESAASSPGSLSSPPHSPDNAPLSNKVGVAVGDRASPPPPATTTSTTPRLTASGAVRKKPGPKPKPKDPNAPEKKRRARKPAEPKDSAAEPAPRKRRTKASLEAQAPSGLSQVEEKHMQQQQSPNPQTKPTEPVTALQPEQPGHDLVARAPRMSSNPEPLHNNPNLSHVAAAPSTPRPASSGQRYDPIRGGLIESKPHSAAAAAPPLSPPLNRASASPSITSLIDRPSAVDNPHSQSARLHQQISVTSAPVSPVAKPSRPGTLLPNQEQQQPAHPAAPTSVGTTPMEIETNSNKPAAGSVPMKKSSSFTTGAPSHSNTPTPPVKPARQKEAPPPLPTGSGLLSGTPFGPVNASAVGSAEPQGANIWLTIPLQGQRTTTTVNFAQEVEKTYGFAALHPKIAARRERLRQVTAAGAALERAAATGSNDDMSLDLSEPESNVEMGGMDDEGSAAGNGVKKRRKRKQEDYDKEDDFIDDTELAWEEKALMAKDGFFVYSGPLIAADEKPTIERADGTVKRGRGRGRGGSTRGETSGRGRGRGGGPGSRGGNTVRKPRVTKADRAMMEQEKLEREKMAATIAASSQPVGQGTTTF